MSQLDELQTIRDIHRYVDNFLGIQTRAQSSHPRSSTARQFVHKHMECVRMLTFLQSEDPSWFLLRAFRFTSRTSYEFISTVFRTNRKNLYGLAHLLAGKRLVFPGNTPDHTISTTVEWCISYSRKNTT